MKKRIIIAYFGTKDEKAMAQLSSFIKELQAESSVSCGSISLMHKDVANQLVFPADEKILMLPLLIQRGGTYEKLISCGFETAPPLLCRAEDIRECASVINRTLEKKTDHNYILIAHGDEMRRIEEYGTLQNCLRDDVIITALKGKDRYTDVFPSCRNITLIPFLLTCGHHAAHEINTGCREHFMKRGYSVTTVESGILSLFPGIRGIFIRHMKELEKE